MENVLIPSFKAQEQKPAQSTSSPLFSLTPSLDTPNQNRGAKKSKYLWVSLVGILRHDRQLRELLKANINGLNLSEWALKRCQGMDIRLKEVIHDYGNQNCMRAISVLEDLTGIKGNQYKFMFEGLTLAAAVDATTLQSKCLWKSLADAKAAKKTFVRLLHSWIDYLYVIHKVPAQPQQELRRQIILQVGMVCKIDLGDETKASLE